MNFRARRVAIKGEVVRPADLRGKIGRCFTTEARRENRGLLRGIGPDGKPELQGAGMDPLIVESRRFYDALGYPGAEPLSVDYHATTDAPTVVSLTSHA